MEHALRTHARYSASAAERWTACPGSIHAIDGVAGASVPSDYALDGTEAHELLEYALANGYRHAREAFLMSEFVWTHRHDDYQVRLDSVQTVLDYAWAILDRHVNDARLYLEVQFVFPTELQVDAGGTADIMIYIPLLMHLHVIDFKHGAGTYVPVEGNKQLLFYGIGGMSELWRNGLRVMTATLTVVQPRIEALSPIRSWDVTANDLIFYRLEFDKAIIACEQPDAPRIPGETQCHWCPFASECPEAEQFIISRLFPQDFPASFPLPTIPSIKTEVPSVVRLSEILAAAPYIRQFLTDAEDYAGALIRSGTLVPGVKLVEVAARRRWRAELSDQDVAAELARVTGLHTSYFTPPKLVGIGEAEKALKEAYDRSYPTDKKARNAAVAQVMANLTLKDTSGNLTLVPATDKRPAYDVVAKLPAIETIGE